MERYLRPSFLASARELLGRAAFRRMWGVGIFVSLSRWFEMVAIAIFVLELTGSPTQVALAAGVRMAPMVLLGPLIGLLADSGNRRRLLVAVYGLITLSAAAMALLVSMGDVPYLAVLTAAFVVGLSFVAELPLRRAMLADAVPPEQVVRATGLDAMTNNAARMLGPLLVAAAYPLFGGPGAYTIVAVFHLAAWVLLLLTPASHDAPQVAQNHRWSEALMPPKEVRNVRLWCIVGTAVVFNLTSFSFMNLIPVFVEDRFGGSAELIGLFAAAEGLGATLGTLVVAAFVSPASIFRSHYLGVAGGLAVLLVLSIAGNAGLGLAVTFAFGVAGAFFFATQYSAVHANVESVFRSRAFGLLSIFIGINIVGSLNLGLLFETFGVTAGLRVAVLEGAVLLAAIGVIWLRFARR